MPQFGLGQPAYFKGGYPHTQLQILSENIDQEYPGHPEFETGSIKEGETATFYVNRIGNNDFTTAKIRWFLTPLWNTGTSWEDIEPAANSGIIQMEPGQDNALFQISIPEDDVRDAGEQFSLTFRDETYGQELLGGWQKTRGDNRIIFDIEDTFVTPFPPELPYPAPVDPVFVSPAPEHEVTPPVTPTPAPEPEPVAPASVGDTIINGGGNTIGSYNNATIINNYGSGNVITGDQNTVQQFGLDVVTGMRGRDSMRCTQHEDVITIQGDGRDRIRNFESGEDLLQLDTSTLRGGGIDDPQLSVAKMRRDVRHYMHTAVDLIYFKPKGKLIYNSNGEGRGKGAAGGLIASLGRGTELVESDLELINLSGGRSVADEAAVDLGLSGSLPDPLAYGYSNGQNWLMA